MEIDKFIRSTVKSERYPENRGQYMTVRGSFPLRFVSEGFWETTNPIRVQCSVFETSEAFAFSES